jgi:hypothetical protein
MSTTSRAGRIGRQRLTEILALALTPEAKTSFAEKLETIQAVVGDRTGRKPRTLVADLKCKILAPEAGPLAFARLTGISRRDAESLADKGFLRALSSPKTTAPALHALATYGDLLTSVEFPEATQAFGGIVEALALAALAGRHAAPLSPGQAALAIAVLDAIRTSEMLPKVLQEYAARMARTLLGYERDSVLSGPGK